MFIKLAREWEYLTIVNIQQKIPPTKHLFVAQIRSVYGSMAVKSIEKNWAGQPVNVENSLIYCGTCIAIEIWKIQWLLPIGKHVSGSVLPFEQLAILVQ